MDGVEKARGPSETLHRCVGEGEKWMGLLLAGCQNCKYYFVKCEGMESEATISARALFPHVIFWSRSRLLQLPRYRGRGGDAAPVSGE